MATKLMTLDFPTTVKWYITGRCNLRCRHCYLTDYTKEVSLDKILPVIDYLYQNGTRHIYFLGGEPLIRKDFSIILSHCQNLGMNAIVATNATMLSSAKAQELRMAGLRVLQVSLDSANREAHEDLRGLGTFEKTIAGIKNAKAAGFLVNLAFVAHAKNHDEVYELLRLANSLAVDLVRIMPLIPIGTAGKNPELKLTEASGHSIQTQEDLARQHFPNLKISNGLSRQLKFAKPSPFSCGAGTMHLIINSDLTLSACDLGTELERTEESIEKPSDISHLWKTHAIFNSWRNKEAAHCSLGKTMYPELSYF